MYDIATICDVGYATSVASHDIALCHMKKNHASFWNRFGTREVQQHFCVVFFSNVPMLVNKSTSIVRCVNAGVFPSSWKLRCIVLFLFSAEILTYQNFHQSWTSENYLSHQSFPSTRCPDTDQVLRVHMLSLQDRDTNTSEHQKVRTLSGLKTVIESGP